MRVARAAEKFKVPRYQIDYWRKTGLLSNDGAAVLDFEDLLRLRFIVACKEKRVSLQKIRGFIHLNVDANREPGGPRGLSHLRLLDSATLVLEESGRLIQPDTGQLYIDFDGNNRMPGKVVHFEQMHGADELRQEERMSALERRFQTALSSLDNSETKQILEEILSIEPDHVGALIEFGNLAFEIKNYDEAIEYYERALKLNSNCVEAVYNLANLYFKQKKHAVAIRYYQTSIELDPEFPETYYNLALVYYSLRYLEKARSLFEYYIGMDPESDWRRQADDFLEQIDRFLRDAEADRAGTLFQNDFDIE